MSADIEEAVDKDERAMERMAAAFESIALTLANFYDKMYPTKHEPRDVTLTRIPTDLDRIKEAQGATQETTEEWLDIGPRERDLVERAKIGEPRRPSRSEKKASSAGTVKGHS